MSRIGRAVIEVLLRSDKAKSDIRGVKQDVQALKSEASGDALSPLAKSAETASISFVGLGTAITTAFAAFKAGNQVFAFFDGLINRAEDARQKMDDLNEGANRAISGFLKEGSLRGASAITRDIDRIGDRAKAEVEAYNKAVEKELGSDTARGWAKVWEMATGVGGSANPLTALRPGTTISDIQRTQLEKTKQINDAANSDIKDTREQYEKDFAANSKKKSDEMRESALSNLDRIDAKEKRQLEEMSQKRKEFRSPEAQSAIDEQMQAIRAAAEADREAQRQKEIERINRENEAGVRKGEADAKEEMRAKEAAERIAKHAADAWSKEMERATRDLYSAINKASQAQNNSLQQSLGSVTADVSRIAELVNMRLASPPIDRRN